MPNENTSSPFIAFLAVHRCLVEEILRHFRTQYELSAEGNAWIEEMILYNVEVRIFPVIGVSSLLVREVN